MSQHIPSDKRAEICLQYLRQIAVNNKRMVSRAPRPLRRGTGCFRKHGTRPDRAHCRIRPVRAISDGGRLHLPVLPRHPLFSRQVSLQTPFRSLHQCPGQEVQPWRILHAPGTGRLSGSRRSLLPAVGRPACRTPEHLRTTGNFPPHRGQRSVPQPVSRTGRNTGENHPQGISQGLPLP